LKQESWGNSASIIGGRNQDMDGTFKHVAFLAPRHSRLETGDPQQTFISWEITTNMTRLPSGNLPSDKHTKNYGKSPCLMGKSTISMAMFNSYVKLPEGDVAMKVTFLR
jgi:hypothetical protein